MKKFFIFIVILAVVILAFFGFWSVGKKSFSKDVLKLEILGPNEAIIGEQIEYIVKYRNMGDFRLEQAKLLFECPSDSLECALVEKEKISQTEFQRKEVILEDIYPGQGKIFHFKVKLLGKASEAKEIKAEITFKPKNLEAVYSVETIFLTQIKETPITFEFDLPSKIESGREIEFSLNYFSHLDLALSDLLCVVEYPADFEFLESTPETTFSQDEWAIPQLGKLEGGKIKIKGKIGGEIGKGKKFRARLELWKEGGYILLKETEKVVEIIKPLLYISQRINKSTDFIASPGDTLNYEIFFRNIGETSFEKQILMVRLEGEAFDFASLNLRAAEYKPEESLIIWSWQNIPCLKYLEVGQEGKVEFSIKLKDQFIPKGDGGKILTKVNIPPIEEEFEIKVKSRLEISQKVFFEEEFFGNSGPLPPEIGETTTYTILWQAKSCCNKMENVKVLGKLPVQVNLTGKFFPEEEISKFFFDSKSREISWQIEDFGPNETKVLAFQVSFKPVIFQKGERAVIIEEAKISGEDNWIEKNLQDFSPAIDTTLQK